ncbi:hypothetical protein HY500_02955 [Candidatus Woesearchaeota archaeon]|nr:hypothetical protein [Candidatus Woesearchaeota archaeon]
MKKRDLVVFSLLVVSMFIIAGCKEGAVGKPKSSQQKCLQGNTNCVDPDCR